MAKTTTKKKTTKKSTSNTAIIALASVIVIVTALFLFNKVELSGTYKNSEISLSAHDKSTGSNQVPYQGQTPAKIEMTNIANGTNATIISGNNNSITSQTHHEK